MNVLASRNLTSYQKRIVELHEEIEKSARKLGEVRGSQDTLLSSIGFLQRQNETLQNECSRLTTSIRALEKDKMRKEEDVSELTKISSHLHSDIDISTSELRQNKNKIGLLLNEYMILTDSIKSLTIEKQKLSKIVQDKQIELRGISSRVSDCLTKLSTRESEIEKKEQELKVSINKNGRILTSIEVNRGKLEHYVKRLQRYYDQNNIKLNILDKFDIKVDNK